MGGDHQHQLVGGAQESHGELTWSGGYPDDEKRSQQLESLRDDAVREYRHELNGHLQGVQAPEQRRAMDCA